VATLLTDLAEGLQQRGHEVHLFAASGSQFPGLTLVDTGVDPSELAETLFRPLAQPLPSEQRRHRLETARKAFATAYDAIREGTYDLVHNHAFDAPAVELARDLDVPVVHTLHLPPDPEVAAALADAAGDPRPPVVAAVSVSQCRGWATHARIDGLLRPGVPTVRIPWSESSGGALLFAGRLSPEKGVLDAIEIARRSERELVIAGGRYDPGYAGEVERAARATPGVTVAGAMPRTDLWRTMANSAALVFPIRWEEPFGMVCAEAQAAGCPVIGFARGALTDVIREGVTGAALPPGDLDAAAAAVSDLGRFDRVACRRHAEGNLDLGPMIEAHLELYKDLLAR
jgi:glycosyltransferase involved in cell wall biosynthesis